tara:strand:+ start:348 stop:1103 length:756 start_codon:yes stop_codon:yes gene_type:complete
MNKFFTVNVNPVMTYANRNNTFQTGDLVSDWFAFDLPNGGNKLISAYLIGEPGALPQIFSTEVVFAKDLVVGNKIIAPFSLGTVTNSANGGTYQSHLLGFLQSFESSQTTTNLDFGYMQRLTTESKDTNQNEIVLQGHPDTGTLKGLSRIYVGILSSSSTSDLDLRAGTLTNGGGTAGDATLTVDGTSAFRVMSVGDQLIDEDEQELGTIESINGLGTIITFDKNGLLNTVGNSKRVATKSPIKLVLGFER